MNSLLNGQQDEDVEDMRARGAYGKDREITLGTTVVLGIFFALAVFGAVFFGFGYSMGAKHAANTVVAGEGVSSSSFNSFKPAPGNPLGNAAAKPAGETVSAPFAPAAISAPVSAKPLPVKAPAEAFTETEIPAAPAVAAPRPAARTATVVSAAPPATPLPPSAGPQSVVQVAAVSHQEDADLLVSTLKRRGYNVAVHTEAQDKLLHVQIGPFGNRKDADAMRQKLLADGFNAIVK